MRSQKRGMQLHVACWSISWKSGEITFSGAVHYGYTFTKFVEASSSLTHSFDSFQIQRQDSEVEKETDPYHFNESDHLEAFWGKREHQKVWNISPFLTY